MYRKHGVTLNPKKDTKPPLAVAKCHEKVANARADFQHKLSLTLVDENQAVIVETLKLQTGETYLGGPWHISEASWHISEASWHIFVVKLEYKLKEQGKHQWYASSKTCHCGGH